MRSPVLTAVLLMLSCTLLVAGTTLIAKALGNGAMGEVIPAAMTSQARFVFGALTVALVLGLRRASGRPAWVATSPTTSRLPTDAPGRCAPRVPILPSPI